jgi:hypothetical protein
MSQSLIRCATADDVAVVHNVTLRRYDIVKDEWAEQAAQLAVSSVAADSEAVPVGDDGAFVVVSFAAALVPRSAGTLRDRSEVSAATLGVDLCASSLRALQPAATARKARRRERAGDIAGDYVVRLAAMRHFAALFNDAVADALAGDGGAYPQIAFIDAAYVETRPPALAAAAGGMPGGVVAILEPALPQQPQHALPVGVLSAVRHFVYERSGRALTVVAAVGIQPAPLRWLCGDPCVAWGSATEKAMADHICGPLCAALLLPRLTPASPPRSPR